MIDIHTHILPAVDDGSASTEESEQMLRLAKQQGVDLVFATPHFSAVREDPDSFVQRRQAARDALCLSEETMPQLRLGAEVAYFGGMSHCQELTALCLEGTSLILIEMPFAPWTDRIVTDICSIRQQLGLTPVLAHVERYTRNNQMGRYYKHLIREALFQCNAEYFLRLGTRHKALRQLKDGQIHLLGSDAHNLTHRISRMDEAAALIRKKLGEDALAQLKAPVSLYKE